MLKSEINVLIENIFLFICKVLFLNLFHWWFLLYSSLYAAIGAAVDSETDSQQFMMPIIIEN